MIRSPLPAALALACLLGGPAAAATQTTTTTTTDTATVHHAPGKTTKTTRTTASKTTKSGTATKPGKTTTTVTHSTTTHTGGHTGTTTRTTQTTRSRTAAPAPRHSTHRPVAKAVPPAAPAAAAPPPVIAAAPPTPPAAAKGNESGLPLPRFVALRSDQVSFRAGPGTRYPIDWVYQRRYLPVKVEREFEVWRLVSEPDGTKGWVHQAMLTGRRGFIVTGTDPQTIRAAALPTAAAVAVVKPGVVGRLLSCAATAEWCRVQVKTYQGWLPRTAFWGTLPNEAVAP